MSQGNFSESSQNFTFSSLMIINRLGRGSTSHVFKTQSIKTKKYYAMKVIDKQSSEYEYESLARQISIHSCLDHTHISRFVKHFEDEQNHYILSEYCNNGQITKFLHEPVSEQKIKKVAYQVALALDYMHNQVGFAHGDLKLSNILINGQQLKLCDFGFSINLNQKSNSANSNHKTYGTLLYMSPQILLNNKNQHYKQADVWALGICLLTLMVQGNPYNTQSPNALKKKIMNSDYIKPNKTYFPQYSEQILSLVARMLEPKYSQRIKIREVLKNPCFQSLSRKRQLKRENQILQNIKTKDRINIEKINQIDRKFSQKQLECTRQTSTQKQNIQQNQQSQKQDQINKSIFNLTVDTDTEHQQQTQQVQQPTPAVTTPSDNPTKIFTYSLKPQRHMIGNDAYIEVLNSRQIKIKIQKVEYLIEPNGETLQLLKGSKELRKYTWWEIRRNQKICNFYNYAYELVAVLKRRQKVREAVVGGRWFWVDGKALSCVINQYIIYRNFQEKQIYYSRIGIQPSKYSSEKNFQLYKYVQQFKQGQRIFMQKNKSN